MFHEALENNLPLDLTHFIARCLGEGQGIRIVWKTTDEQNIATYIVQRSKDGETFEDVAAFAAT